MLEFSEFIFDSGLRTSLLQVGTSRGPIIVILSLGTELLGFFSLLIEKNNSLVFLRGDSQASCRITSL